MDKFGLNFGLVIAYLLPGFLALYGIADFSVTIQALLGGATRVPSGAAAVPLVLLALTAGATINALSWAFVRPLIALTGVTRPKNLDYTRLKPKDLDLYNTIVEGHFRYHQFYANMLVAVLILAPTWIQWPFATAPLENGALFVLCSVLFLAARDALSRAFTRMAALNERGDHHDQRTTGSI